jgi:hypothetical protein
VKRLIRGGARQVRRGGGWIVGRLVDHATADPLAPLPPAGAHLERVLSGFAQPLLAIRLLARDEALRQAALAPAILLASFCALAAWIKADDGVLAHVKYFYQTFAVLAPVPPIVLMKHYARLAAAAHRRMGLGPCEVYYKGLMRSLWEAAAQAVIVAVAVAPVKATAHLLPKVGTYVAAAIVALWALHWIVVEALDNARVLHAGETGPQLDAEEARARAPWFVRPFRAAAGWAPRWVGIRTALSLFARFCGWLSRPWHDEIDLVERHPWLVYGFSLSTALLLAVPGLNLLFRPIIVVASVHLVGHLTPSAARAALLPVPVADPASSGH